MQLRSFEIHVSKKLILILLVSLEESGTLHRDFGSGEVLGGVAVSFETRQHHHRILPVAVFFASWAYGRRISMPCCLYCGIANMESLGRLNLERKVFLSSVAGL